ncbi:MAG: serine/threonine protein kinase [Polyangiaceae bacterium]|nr:serine/threonine protein kinase [Polyangiaceae bacterium]
MHPGEVLAGRYRLDRQLGAGGFGVVYLATQMPLGRPVAVKVLQHTGDEASARFTQEAALAQRLEHPHTVRILDFGVGPRGFPFIVWEFLRGQTLADLLAARGPLPPSSVRSIGVQILKSLMEAHGLGIVHRDIKPANIFITSHPGEPLFVKVLDFGIAKNLFAAPDPVGPTLAQASAQELIQSWTSSSQTRASQMLGTPRYMAPEQAHCQPVGPETDLYAVGLLLAEMLTGKQVFCQDNALELLMAHGSDDPVPIPPNVANGPLGPIILRATQKQRARRFQSAGEMLSLLESAPIADGPISTTFGSGAQAAISSQPHTQLAGPIALDPTRGARIDPTQQYAVTPPVASPAAKPRAASRAPWILLVVTLLVAAPAIALAFVRPWETKAKTKKRAHTDDTSETTKTSAPSAKDPFDLPAPPVVEWSKRKVPAYDAQSLKAKLQSLGWEIRDEKTTSSPGFSMVTVTVAKPPCGGAVLYYGYADAATAQQAVDGLSKSGYFARVMRNDKNILHIAVARVNHAEGDPACTDPLGVALTE